MRTRIIKAQAILVLLDSIQEISQLIKQAISEIHEEGDEVRFGSFNR